MPATYVSAVLLIAGVTAAWLGWKIVSRLFLSPLASIPGPRLAAISSWYECYYDVLCRPGGGYYPFKLKELHEQYGPIIRLNPDEIHINDIDFLDTIYALRDRNVPQTLALMVEGSMGAAEEFNLHKLRREAANPFFSLRTIMALESRIRDQVSKLVDVLNENCGNGNPLNLTDAYYAFSNDLVRAFCFGSSNSLLGDLTEAHVQRTNLTRLLMNTRFRQHFPWVPSLAAKLPSSAAAKTAPPAVIDLLRFRQSIMQDIKRVLSDEKNDFKGGHSVFHELRDSPILPQAEKRPERLQSEATLIVMAGTESTQKSLAIVTFYLLTQSDVLNNVRQELVRARTEAGDMPIPLATLMNLPYLNGVIQEAHRLSFGVTGRMLRYSPGESLEYTASYGPNKGKVYKIPPRTTMSCVTYCTHIHDELFPDPWVFEPKRWIGAGEDVNKRKRCMMALGKGHKRCLGMHLAQAALSLVLEKLVEFDMTLYDTVDDDVKFIYDQQVSQPRIGSAGVRAFIHSRHE